MLLLSVRTSTRIFPSDSLIVTTDDKMKATTSLRAVTAPQTRHLSTFRTGLYLGLAVPALIDGLYRGQHLFE